MTRSSGVPLLLLLFASCSRNIAFQADEAVPDGKWARAWQPEFAFEVTDTIGSQDVYIDLRHTGDYAFSELYLFVRVTGPGLPVAVDTVACQLADPTGRWYGDGLGFIKSLHVLYKQDKRFPRPGRYSIKLEQAMRVDPLDGVIDVGISVEKSASAD